MANTSTTELARRCGVSQGTVDRALHGRPGIAEATRQRILAEAAKLGYVPHHAARALITGSHHLIGLILFGLDNQFTARVIRAIEHEAHGAGYDLLVAFSNRDPEVERRYLRRFLERHVDGIILFPVTRDSEELQLAVKRKVPVVSLFNRLDSPKANEVSLDEAAAMRSLAGRLAVKGCRKVVFLTYPVHPGENQDALFARRDAFCGAAKRERIEVTVCTPDKIPPTLDGFDAFVCHNDLLAVRLLQSATHASPTVTGFDAADEVNLSGSLAATFAVPYDQIARHAVEWICKRRFGSRKVFDPKPIWNQL